MYTARMQMQLGGMPAERAERALWPVLVALTANGQLGGTAWPAVEQDGCLSLFLSVPDASALAPEAHGSEVLQALAQLEAAGWPRPTFEVLGADPCSAAPCACDSASGLILAASHESAESPLRCFDCFGPIALYRVEGARRSEVFRWLSAYRAVNALEVAGTTGKRFATKELADARSKLSRLGRQICGGLSAQLGKPVYYLLRRRLRERATSCPSCGDPWTPAAQGPIDRQCRACALVSAPAQA